jgi:hypothetical protein
MTFMGAYHGARSAVRTQHRTRWAAELVRKMHRAPRWGATRGTCTSARVHAIASVLQCMHSFSLTWMPLVCRFSCTDGWLRIDKRYA